MKLSPIVLTSLTGMLPDLLAHNLVVRVHDLLGSRLALVLTEVGEPTTSVNITVMVAVSFMTHVYSEPCLGHSCRSCRCLFALIEPST